MNAAAEITAHDKLIRYLAFPLTSRGVALEDLVQEGRIALLGAIKSWRPDEGAKLWTYARKFVFGAMMRFASNESAEPCRLGVAAEDAPETVDQALTPEALFEQQECAAIARAHVAELSGVERDVLRMHLADDLGFSEIRRSLDLSSNDKTERVYHGAVATLRERVGARL